MRIRRIVPMAVLVAFATVASAQERYSLRGTVHDADGDPAPALIVRVVSGQGSEGSSRTGDDGRYYVGGLKAGTYEVVVSRRGGGPDLLRKRVRIERNTTLDLRLH